MLTPKKKIPIKKLAEELNVSISTVSRALNNHPRISNETKEKVFALAQKMNLFEPSPLQAMIGLQSRHVAILIPNVSGWYYKTFLDGVRGALSKINYHGIILEYNTANDDDFMMQVDYAYSLPICGAIIHVPEMGELNLQQFNKKELPTVLLGTSAKCPYPKLITDFFMETYMAVSHLFNTGCKRIVYLSKPSDSYLVKTRVRGFQKAIEFYKIEALSYIECSDSEQTGNEDKLRMIIGDSDFDREALVVDDARLVPVLLRLLDFYSLKVPSQVKIVSLDQDDLMQVLTPSITTVLTPLAEIGRSSVQIINKLLLDHKSVRKDSLIIVKPKLIIRNSSIQ